MLLVKARIKPTAEWCEPFHLLNALEEDIVGKIVTIDVDRSIPCKSGSGRAFFAQSEGEGYYCEHVVQALD